MSRHSDYSPIEPSEQLASLAIAEEAFRYTLESEQDDLVDDELDATDDEDAVEPT